MKIFYLEMNNFRTTVVLYFLSVGLIFLLSIYRLDNSFDKPHCFLGNKEFPIWHTGTKSLSSSEIIHHLLFERDHIELWICQKQPLSISWNATFIVDQPELPSRNDVFVDYMGVWRHTGSPSQYFQVKTTKSGDLQELVLGKKHPTEMSQDVYRIKKNYSCHHAASDLSRTVIFIEGLYITVYI